MCEMGLPCAIAMAGAAMPPIGPEPIGPICGIIICGIICGIIPSMGIIGIGGGWSEMPGRTWSSPSRHTTSPYATSVRSARRATESGMSCT